MSDEAYDEQKVIDLVTEYYQLLFSLCYLSADDVDFPPPEGREIDPELCESLGLTPEVISLMRRLPCPREEGVMLGYQMFIPGSFANSFVNNKLIELGRDPEIAERLDFLAPAHIALSIMDDEGACLVLDSARNTLRVVTFDPPNDPEDEDEPNLEYDFDPASASDHYTRFPVRNPTRFLKSCIDHVRSLIWLPRREYGGGVISTGGPEYENVKKMLIEEYGWLNDFKSDAWERDYETIFKENS